MSTTYISVEVRRTITLRAQSVCEYCLIHADDTYWDCQIDHIISEKYAFLTPVLIAGQIISSERESSLRH